MTLKTGLGFVQGHWKWHHLIDCIRVPIRLVTMAIHVSCIVCEIFIPNLYLASPQGVTRSEFCEMFDAGKTSDMLSRF